METNYLEFIKSRRSTRKYKEQQIEPAQLTEVLEAGRYV